MNIKSTMVNSIHSAQIIQNIISIHLHLFNFGGRDSVHGIATRHELDDPGIESRWWRDFPQLSRLALGPPSLPHNGYRVSFLRVKRPTQSSAEVKERVEPYLYSFLSLHNLFQSELHILPILLPYFTCDFYRLVVRNDRYYVSFCFLN